MRRRRGALREGVRGARKDGRPHRRRPHTRERRTEGDRKTQDPPQKHRKKLENVDTENADLEVAETDDIRADPDRLCRVFENLFRNATEHNNAGVTVRVGTSDGGFYVEDDPSDERQDVFEYGYTRGEGTGLGLSIVETIVEAHGREVSVVESDEGGARFGITE